MHLHAALPVRTTIIVSFETERDVGDQRAQDQLSQTQTYNTATHTGTRTVGTNISGGSPVTADK